MKKKQTTMDATPTALERIERQLGRIERLTAIGAKNVLTLEEAAEYTCLGKSTLYDLTSKGEIPHSKRSRRCYFAKSELNGWMMEHRQTTREEIESRAATHVALKRLARN